MLHLRGQRREAEAIHHQAVEMAQQLIQESPQVPDYPSQLGHLLHNFALFLIDRKELARRYADDAMRALRGAVDRGFHDGEQLRRDKALQSLRGRTDFRALQAELDAAGGMEP